MPKVKFTSALNRFFPDLKAIDVEADSIIETIEQIEQAYPGMKSFILEDSGQIRKHVNIFIGDQLIQSKSLLDYKIDDAEEIYIFQALSGG